MTDSPRTAVASGPSLLIIAVGWAGLLVALDLITKGFGEAYLELGEARWLIDGVIGLERTRNSGVAFSLLEGQWVVWPLLAGAMMGLGFIVRDIARRASHPTDVVPITMICAGAAGNLIDRLGDGRVTDLIAIGPWPRFNIADSSLTIGLVLLLVQAVTTKGQDHDDQLPQRPDHG